MNMSARCLTFAVAPALSGMPPMITPEIVIDLLTSEHILDPQEPITPEADLFALGLDSMAMMQLLLQIEEHFGLSISPAELSRDRFATAAALARFLQGKRAGC
jgi:acyl carrier protein